MSQSVSLCVCVCVCQSVELVGTSRSQSLVNGHSDVIDDVTADDDVAYRPVDFCIPVGPIFNFITGQYSRSTEQYHR